MKVRALTRASHDADCKAISHLMKSLLSSSVLALLQQVALDVLVLSLNIRVQLSYK